MSSESVHASTETVAANVNEAVARNGAGNITEDTAISNESVPSANTGSVCALVGYSTDIAFDTSPVSKYTCDSGTPCQTDVTCTELDEMSIQYQLASSKAKDLEAENIVLKSALEESKKSLNTLTAENECIKKDNVNLRLELIELKGKLASWTISEDTLKNDNARVKFYTGLPTFSLLLHILNFVGCKIEHTHRNALPKFSEFLMTLMRLRLGLLEQDLAYRFSVSQSTVSSFCDRWIRMMSARLSSFLIWPERDVLSKTMPQAFQVAFGKKVAVIIDCFEIFIARSSSLVTRAETWSQYKHHNTVKYPIGITPQGTVCFISRGWGGRSSDKIITLSSGFLTKLTPGDVVLADRGFDIADDIGMYRAKLEIPAFTKGKSQLSFDDVHKTKTIANVRIHVERVIGFVRRKYRILSGLIPVESVTPKIEEDDAPIDHIVKVCCALCNFCPPTVEPVIPSTSEEE